jgi:hypothetical protein
MLIPAVIGIVTFLLAVLPSTGNYYQAPMAIIGKFYANSMLVLINSRMLLQVGSEEARKLKIISTIGFDATRATSTAYDTIDSAHITEISLSGQDL